MSIRLTDGMLGRLDALAADRGVTRTRLVRQLLDAGLDGRAVPPADPPSHDELVEILSERARAGNVAAVRALLAMKAETDPRSRAFRVLEEIMRERRS